MDDTTIELASLLDRLRRREPGAIQELIARAHTRLRKLAAKMLHESFPKIADQHDVDSVVSETYPRLAKALESVDLPTPADFFRFAAHKVRQTLLDMADDAKREVPASPVDSGSTDSQPGFDPGMTTLDPVKLAVWSELHRRVEELPEDVKAVFVPCYYLGLTQAEVATAIGEHPREVSRLWFKATVLLKKYLPEGE